MSIKFIIIICIKYKLIIEKNHEVFWKKKIGIKLYFFSKNFINKIFNGKKHYFIFNKFRNIHKVLKNPRKLRRHYKLKKRVLPVIFEKKTRFTDYKGLGKTLLRRPLRMALTQTNVPLLYNSRRLGMIAEKRRQNEGKKIRKKKSWIITKGWKKGRIGRPVTPRKYYYVHKKYAPHFLTVWEVVRLKLWKKIFNSQYRETMYKKILYIIEKKEEIEPIFFNVDDLYKKFPEVLKKNSVIGMKIKIFLKI